MSPSRDLPLLLVVDDDPVNRDLLGQLLCAMEYRVIEAAGGEQALEVAWSEDPDLIILDIMMPGMTGYEVCRTLKRDPRTANTPVVFVTALSGSDDKLQAIEAGGDDFLTKPFDRPLLLARVRSLLRLKEANNRLESSYLRLRELEQYKEDLMQMIVHDLKSPLGTVLGTLEMALDGELGRLSGDGARLAGDALERGDDALQLVEDLLDVSRLEEPGASIESSPVGVAGLLQSVGGDWRVRAERRRARLRVDPGPEVTLRADRRLLSRVLSNLIGNALRHGGKGVSVLVSARCEGEEVRFTVADDGGGISPEVQEVIFEKFAKVGGGNGLRTGSSGLGLTFVRLAVEAHGGEVWVESEPGRGSRFHFRLPAQLSAPAPSPASAHGGAVGARP